MKKNKKVLVANNVPNQHWVGNGFYGRGLLRSTEELKEFISPFILLDYASPRRFSSTSVPRGVDVHPHRGFETVTVVYQGEIEHQDSAGGGGVIKPGDVQWMTAGKGIIHKEFHSKEFSEVGGMFEMVQLWINLPQKYKMTNPKYQGIKSEDIPILEIGKNSMLRLISGEYENENGAASTFTKINLYDLSSKSEDEISRDMIEDFMKEYCNLFAGAIKSSFENKGFNSSIISLKVGLFFLPGIAQIFAPFFANSLIIFQEKESKLSINATIFSE